jgi:hypothetical protein
VPAVETEAVLCMDLAVTEPPSCTEVIGGNLLQTKHAHTHMRTNTTRARTHRTPMQERERHLWSSQSCNCNGVRAPGGFPPPPPPDLTDGGRADRCRSSNSCRLSRWLNALRFPKEICVNVYARTKQMCLLKGPSPNDLLSDVQKISSPGKV